MSFIPNPMQDKVIRHRNGSLLVAAAAGSGKTTTLIAHVMSRLCESEPRKRGDLRRMIIVTYTNAAASEMRAKLIKELGKAQESDPGNAWLRLQSEIVGQAHICTVDSLCGFLVRSYFDRLNISPDIRIADSAELVLLKEDVLDALMEEKYAAGDDEDFFDLVTDYSSEKSDGEIRKMVLQLYETAQNALYPEEWLAEAEKPQPEKEEDFFDQDWIRESDREIERTLAGIEARLEALRQEVLESRAPQRNIFLPVLQDDEAHIRRLLGTDLTGKLKLFSEKTKWARKPALQKKTANEEDEALDERVKAVRDACRSACTELEKRYGVTRRRADLIARDQANKATEAIKRVEGQHLGVKVGIWVHIPGTKTSRATHKAMNGKPFLLSEGMYDSAVGRKVLPGELVACACTYRDFVPEFGDQMTPEIKKLLATVENVSAPDDKAGTRRRATHAG